MKNFLGIEATELTLEQQAHLRMVEINAETLSKENLVKVNIGMARLIMMQQNVIKSMTSTILKGDFQ